MPWIRLAIETRGQDPEQIADLLLRVGATSVSLESANDQSIYEPLPGEARLWVHTRVIGLFAEDTDGTAVLEQIRYAINDPHLKAAVTTLADQNWERLWMDRFHPLCFGSRLWVVPRLHKPPNPQGINIFLDPGLAFGTGTHVTTALCLEWLDAQNMHGKRVVDYGCGSGILAIAAAKLGAKRVWAVDHDPQALHATKENAAVNGMATNIDVCLPNDLSAQSVDIILANILAETLVRLTLHYAHLVQEGGWIVLSGVLSEQSEVVQAAYRPWFNMEHRTIRDGWVRLVGQRLSLPACPP